MYFVAEWIDTDAPRASGRCRYGVAKQLSTTKGMPRDFANAPSQTRSMSSSPGLDGVSMKISFVLGFTSRSQLDGSPTSA